MKRKKMRDAIAMIELIFTIVVIGIVLMSTPMLVQTASRSGYVALQQEAIAAAASELGIIMTQGWDDNADENGTTESPILKTLGDTQLEENGNTGIRSGTPDSSFRKYITSTGGRKDATLAGNFTSDGDYDDIDDFHNHTTTLYSASAAEADFGDYVDNSILMNTQVSYVKDTPTSGNYNTSATISLDDPFTTAAPNATSNIKAIRIILTSTSGVEEMNKTIALNAFSCNIGTYDLEERNF